LYRVMNVPNGPLFRMRLDGLNSEYNYQIDDGDTVISGAQLMNYGMNEPKELTWGDFNGKVIHLTAV
ncbi:MAG TPA: GH36 C-terminal domain-containing protein, partial [Mobilitalea sp.]|nr:GH36 C-terminal domain-containing protein [Mobilitalea sp.]